ncbi:MULTISPECIES: hypothetical protein [Cryobacterium]|uniref:hypothetical protein n=1 Tax=Cryobacterium TaxID=69578 RepID=UPI0018E09D32|nr:MULTISPECIES: hypothetical protein [Cryobacterium]
MNPDRLPKPPAEPWQTVRYVGRSVAATGMLLARRRVHLPRQRVGRRLPFTDGSEAVVYRETIVDRGPTLHPTVLIVAFRLRVLRSDSAHALFRAESILSTPLWSDSPVTCQNCG